MRARPAANDTFLDALAKRVRPQVPGRYAVTIWLNTRQMQFRTIDGLSIRFGESEDRDDHALLLCPWPESLLAFEQMWSRLAEHTHLVAIDLPGFGRCE